MFMNAPHFKNVCILILLFLFVFSMPGSMMNLYENLCQRCNRTVYQVDRIGPLKDFTFYHTNCFKCADCGSKLTLKTYCNNQNDQVADGTQDSTQDGVIALKMG